MGHTSGKLHGWIPRGRQGDRYVGGARRGELQITPSISRPDFTNGACIQSSFLYNLNPTGPRARLTLQLTKLVSNRIS